MTQAPLEPGVPESAASPDRSHPEGLAPLGGPAEPEAPQHTADPDDDAGVAVEDSVAFELAVEDGAPLPPGSTGTGGAGGEDLGAGADPGAGDLAPEFREPGAV